MIEKLYNKTVYFNLFKYLKEFIGENDSLSIRILDGVILPLYFAKFLHQVVGDMVGNNITKYSPYSLPILPWKEDSLDSEIQIDDLGFFYYYLDLSFDVSVYRNTSILFLQEPSGINISVQIIDSPKLMDFFSFFEDPFAFKKEVSDILIVYSFAFSLVHRLLDGGVSSYVKKGSYVMDTLMDSLKDILTLGNTFMERYDNFTKILALI